MSAAKRALGASIVLGCVLVFAVGGPQSPGANQMIKVAIFSFFGFWIVFAFFFRPARPTRGDAASNFIDAPGSLAHTDHWLRGDTHSDGLHHSGSDGGASHGGGGDGGGGGHTGH